MLNSKNSKVLVQCENTCAYYLRVKITIFFMEKISSTSKLFSDHFYWQSLIKTVRGLLNIHGYYWKTIGNVVGIPLKLLIS